MVNLLKNCTMAHHGFLSFFPMSSASSNTHKVPLPALSSDFDRRVRVVCGCREFRISSEDNRNGRDRQWMSSSIRVISENFFLECKSLSWTTFEPGSQLSELAKKAFSRSGLTSIHLPASVTVIGERCFSGCRSLASITFDPASKFRGSEEELLAACDSE
jgi:hypothetical protein